MSDESLRIAGSERGEFHVLDLEGDVDLASAPTLTSRVSELVAGGARNLVIDLGRVRFMDSSGLAALVAAWQQVRERGAFRVAGANQVVQRVLTITGMDDVFDLYPTVEAALAG